MLLKRIDNILGKLALVPFLILKQIFIFSKNHYFFFVTILTLIFLESFAYFANTQKQPYLIAFHRINRPAYKLLDDFEDEEFYGLDPLLGWCLDPVSVKNEIIKDNCIYKAYLNGNSPDTLRLYISGGSTSDVIIYPFNWPNLLFDSLKAMHYNVIMYNAALSGYTTSQEYLKLIRDNLFFGKIDAHISYFGANEIRWNNAYSPEFTEELFQKLANVNDDIFLPNTLEYIRKKIFKQRDFYLPQIVNKTSFPIQTEKNIRLMNALSKAYHYQFIPILQPGLGAGNFSNGFTEEQKKAFRHKMWYQFALKNTVLTKNYYEDFERLCQSLDFKVYDYTSIFKNVKEYPFLDIHHVKKEYQYIIVENILKTLSERGLLKADHTQKKH